MKLPTRARTNGFAALVGLLPLSAAPRAQEPALELVRELTLPGGRIESLAFSPDGALLATGGQWGDVIVTALRDGALLHRLDATNSAVGAVAFAPSGRWLAAAGEDFTLWEVATGELVMRQRATGAPALAWSHEEDRVAWVVDGQTVAVISARAPSELRRIAIEDEPAADAIALSPDGTQVAVGKRSGAVQVFDIASGECVARENHPDPTQGLAWLPNGERVRLGANALVQFGGSAVQGVPGGWMTLTASRDGERIAFRTTRQAHVLARDGTEIELDVSSPIALAPRGSRLARALGAIVEIWNGDQRGRTLVLMHRLRPNDAVLSGDGRYLIARSEHTAQGFTLPDGDTFDVSALPASAGLVPYPYGLEFVTVGERVEWWSVTPRGLRVERSVGIASPRAARRRGHGARFGAGGRLLAIGTVVLDVGDRQAPLVEFDEPILRGLVPSPDGSLVAGIESLPDCLGGGCGWLRVFARDGDERLTMRVDALTCDVDWTPDGKSILLATRDALRVIDAEALAEVASLPFVWRHVRAIGDGYVLGIGSEPALHLWRIGADQPVASLPLPAPASALAPSADGTCAAVTTRESIVVVGVRR